MCIIQSAHHLAVNTVTILSLATISVSAQVTRDLEPVPGKNWPTPLYWQPTAAEAETAKLRPQNATEVHAMAATALPTALVFVGMTPCRVVDTRSSQQFLGAFGPPTLTGGASRTFPMQSSNTCAIPLAARAYSLNITVVPPGPVGYITAYPTGQPVPLAATVNSPQGFIVGNAAIVPGGTNGSIDVFASNPTDLVIDINGYFAEQGGIVLAPGSAAAPSLSFASDPTSGIFSSTGGSFSIATGGIDRFTVRPDGDLELSGSIRKNGDLFISSLGSGNTGIGMRALAAITTGRDNTAIGSQSLSINSTGRSNTAAGNVALLSNTTGSFNTANGEGALQQNSEGNYNVATGLRALTGNTTGIYNTAVGTVALYNNTTGSYNIAIGAESGILGPSAGSGNIYIGSGGARTDDHTIRIGGVGGAPTSFFAGGIRGVTTGLNDAVPVVIDSRGQLGTVNSSRRFKEDIQDMDQVSSGLLRLRPVTFRYAKPYSDGSKPRDYGLIAEEVAEVYPDLVIKGEGGQIETVQYQKLTPMLLNEVQKLHSALKAEREQTRILESRLAKLEAQLAAKVPAVTVQ